MATQEKTYSVGGVRLARPFKLRRLGHFGYNVYRMDECTHFYRSLLGFKQSDIIDFAANPERAKVLEEKGIASGKGGFFHYNTDHHSFVLFPGRPWRPSAEGRRRRHQPDHVADRLPGRGGERRRVLPRARC